MEERSRRFYRLRGRAVSRVDGSPAGLVGVLVFAQALWLSASALVIVADLGNRESPFETWFPALWGAGLVLVPVTILVAYVERRYFLGRAVLVMGGLGAVGALALLLADFLPYAAGWGGRRIDQWGGEMGWEAALFWGLTLWVPVCVSAGAVLAGLVGGARALLKLRLGSRGAGGP